MIARSNESLEHISQWINNTPWLEFLNPNKETRSNTGITFKITGEWFVKMSETKQRRTSVVDFVKTWQASESRQQVADALGVTYGSIASREKTLRKAGVNLKVMAKQPRGIQIDANALNDLISQIDG